MTISMYHASTPLFLRMFGNMNQWLDIAVEKKGAAGAEELLGARLAPDMLPLLGQFQRASDTSKGAIARLAGVDAPSMPDTEKTIADVRQRIAKTADFIKSVPQSKVDGSEEKEVILKTPNNELKFTGLGYLTGFVLPNFYFHATTAYGILRNQGLPLGKLDYLGRA
ncbi:MAG TPA: DUF1993 domain-containing protein [Hyphomonadaceae bacterium]|nr:DUF1993 domain-containing protein [Hyphomonadaceae bacterium]